MLLALLAGRATPLRFDRGVDGGEFLRTTPRVLFPYVYKVLARTGDALGLDAPRMSELATHYRGSLMLHIRRRSLLRTVLQVLTDANLRVAVLKGPVLAHTVYDDPVTRTMSDVDLLVQANGLSHAQRALEGVGFRVPARFSGSLLQPGDVPPLAMPGENDALVELHSILETTADDQDALREVWSRTRQVAIGDLEVTTLAPDDFFEQVVLHLSKHHRFEESLRGLLDVALLLKAQPEIDWAARRERWRRDDVERWIDLTVALAHEMLDAPLPPGFVMTDDIRDAMPLAEAQLWADARERVPPRILFAIARQQPSPVYGHLTETEGQRASGVAAVTATVERAWIRLLRTFSALRRGALKPARISAAVDRFRQRERLVELMESRRDQ